MRKRSNSQPIMDSDRVRHRTAAEPYARLEHNLRVYQDIIDLTVKAQSQIAEIEALLRATQMPVKS